MISSLHASHPEARWIRGEQAHVTLAFLGELTPERTGDIRDAMRESVEGLRPFDMAFGGVGAFPSWEKARVLWLGAARGAEELTALAASLRERLGRRHFKMEKRPFVAHLTLARLQESSGSRTGRDPGLRQLRSAAERWGEPAEWKESAWAVSEIELVASKLTPAGPEYSTLHRQIF